MATKKTPIAARRKAQRDFHESVRLVMLLHEIEKSKDNEHTVEYRHHANRFDFWVTFTLFKSAIKDGNETFSLYIRPELGQPDADVKGAARKVMGTFSDQMNPFSGKWNLECWNNYDALCDELERRIEWMNAREMRAERDAIDAHNESIRQKALEAFSRRNEYANNLALEQTKGKYPAWAVDRAVNRKHKTNRKYTVSRVRSIQAPNVF